MMGLRLSRRVAVFRKDRKTSSVWVAPPVVGESEIYLGDRREIVALDRASLDEKWRVKVPPPTFGPDSGLCPVAVWSSRLVVLRGGAYEHGVFDVVERRFLWQRRAIGYRRWRDQLLLGSDDGLDFVDPETGKTVDSVQGPGIGVGQGAINVSPPRKSDGWYMGYDLAERRECWRRNLAQEARALVGAEVPTVFGPGEGSLSDFFLATGGAGWTGFVLGCSMDDGAIRWKADVYVPYYVPLAVRGRLPILTMGPEPSTSNRFAVVDERTGEVLVDTKPDIGGLYHQQRGCMLGDSVVFSSEAGIVAMFDLESGTHLGTEKCRASFPGCVVADERILLAGGDGHLWVLEAA